jgi:hypothetical protein
MAPAVARLWRGKQKAQKFLWLSDLDALSRLCRYQATIKLDQGSSR